MSTLTYGAIVITLPDDLAWSDEYAWRAVEQRKTYSLTGALLVESALKLAGCPVTLGGDETSGWVSRTTVDLLRVASGIAGQQFALLLRGTTYMVLFDHEAGALEATPVLDVSDPVAADLYVITLRFIKA